MRGQSLRRRWIGSFGSTRMPESDTATRLTGIRDKALHFMMKASGKRDSVMFEMLANDLTFAIDAIRQQAPINGRGGMDAVKAIGLARFALEEVQSEFLLEGWIEGVVEQALDATSPWGVSTAVVGNA